MPHALFSPSSAFRWLNCTKSLTLPKKEERTSEFANRGVALHAMAEDLLLGRQPKFIYNEYTPTLDDIENTVWPYVEYVKVIKASHGFYEQKVFLNDECYGTVDTLLYDETTKVMHVIDLKCGQGVIVPLKNNNQLAIYAIGAINFLREKGFTVDKIFTHIFQPVRGGGEKVEVAKTDLKKFRKRVLQVIEDVKEDNTKYVPSGANCLWCPHTIDCPEVLRQAQLAAREDFMKEISLSEKYKMARVLKHFVKKVEETVFITLDVGEKVPGFKLKDGKKVRKWRDEHAPLNCLYQKGIDTKDFIAEKTLTPLQFEKKLKEKKIEMELDEFIEYRQNRPSIVPE